MRSKYLKARSNPHSIAWSAAAGSRADWDVSANNRRAKSYELTKKGRRQLDEQTDAWRSLTAAINLLLDHS